jgi:hypothetical protein
VPPQRQPAPAPPPASRRRQGLERRSRLVLARLAMLPRWFVLLLVVGLVLAGLALPGAAGAVLLLAVAAVVGWLVALSWPVLPPGQRALRVVLLAMIVGYAAWKVLA